MPQRANASYQLGNNEQPDSICSLTLKRQASERRISMTDWASVSQFDSRYCDVVRLLACCQTRRNQSTAKRASFSVGLGNRSSRALGNKNASDSRNTRASRSGAAEYNSRISTPDRKMRAWFYPHLFRWREQTPSTIICSLVHPRHSVSQPGRPSCFRFWCPSPIAYADRSTFQFTLNQDNCFKTACICALLTPSVLLEKAGRCLALRTQSALQSA